MSRTPRRAHIFIQLLLPNAHSTYRFSGPIPASLSELRNISVLALQNNFLSGHIPAGLLTPLRNLSLLSVNNNLFTGPLPASISTLQHLQVLQLQCNRFEGPLRGILDPSTNRALANIDISDNALTGTLPSELFRLPNLRSIAATKNCFHGEIPSSICEGKNLNLVLLDGLSSGSACLQFLWDPLHLTVGYFASPMKGHIPACIWTLQNLSSLHLSGENNLSLQ